jgi:protoheme IX farnesyltransferase
MSKETPAEERRTPVSLFIAFLRLGKITVSVPVALTGFLGYFLFEPVWDRGALFTTLGVLLLSMGSSAINQIQERRTDALMERTHDRPVPAGTLSAVSALIFSACCVLSGSAFLLLTGSCIAATIGIFTLLWYNLVYTPLKRVTAFAVFPGALIGALPPLIGWSAAGGNLLDMKILSVAFLLFVGQMPHYWLLMLKYGAELKEAGLPVITSLLDPRQIRNLSMIWTAATGSVVLMLPITPVISNRLISIILIMITILFLIRMFLLSYRRELTEHWKKAFITVNLFYLLIILGLIADKIL